MKTQIIIDQLEQFLEEHHHFESIETAKANELIKEAWDERIKDAIIGDLKVKFKEVEIHKINSHFFLEYDQGATVYKLIISIGFDNEKIEAVVKLTCNYKSAEIYLNSNHANEEKYQGKSNYLKQIFNTLRKANDSQGYFSPLNFYLFIQNNPVSY